MYYKLKTSNLEAEYQKSKRHESLWILLEYDKAGNLNMLQVFK